MSNKADFPVKLLIRFNLEVEKGTGEFTNITGTLFRLDDSKSLYNPSDAGQFLWGAWIKYNLYSKAEMWAGSNLNEISTGGDSEADQRTIYKGADWAKF